ncbi:NUDIX hydrolase [Caulobacter sp. CCUG 60055]|nr:NUDIX hydrolase [Caulobacter sp. CCUG 60055]
MAAALQPSFHLGTPEGDERERRICGHCGFIDYVNPKIVVGSVAAWGEGEDARLLLCRRAIEPRAGFWTLPAGFMEEGETVEEAARREAREEAAAEIEIDAVLAIYSIPRISQVQIMHRAQLAVPDVAPGIESLETTLFAWDDIPWADLAFPSVHWALGHWRRVRGQAAFAPFGNPVEGL